MTGLVWALAALQEIDEPEPGPLVTLVMFLCVGAFVLLMVASVWKVFAKAGQPGWAAIVPIYNLIVMLQVAAKPLWWIVLFIIPIVNIIADILVSLAVAEKFGKGLGFGLGLVFLPFVFFPILAFGDARYGG